MIYQRTIHYHATPEGWDRVDGVGRVHGTWRVFVPGATLVAAGIGILLVPQILVALVAGTLLAMGTVALMAAWRIRQALRQPPAPREYEDAERWFGTPVEELLYRFQGH